MAGMGNAADPLRHHLVGLNIASPTTPSPPSPLLPLPSPAPPPPSPPPAGSASGRAAGRPSSWLCSACAATSSYAWPTRNSSGGAAGAASRGTPTFRDGARTRRLSPLPSPSAAGVCLGGSASGQEQFYRAAGRSEEQLSFEKIRVGSFLWGNSLSRSAFSKFERETYLGSGGFSRPIACSTMISPLSEDDETSSLLAW